ncbi:hypothetical protein [Parafrankia discariae]|uniref:hypothetical protein n=1 Tax=Parafrankia discariae TaxID=365528 RepID=UPI000381BEFB|nr:hypothetical protein [Parafrankia discariae]
MSWAEERRADRETARAADRADRAVEREQDRADRIAAAEARRADAAAAEEIRAGREETRKADAEKATARRVAWRRQHAVELLIYPLALVSAAMAIPAMADYGHDLYDSPTGYALPILSELGMWAFALAVHAARRGSTDGDAEGDGDAADRPVGMLQAGIAVFAAVALGLNIAHGLDDGLSVGLVMGVVSIAGVVAHQLAVAAPARSRAQRAQARIDRIAARRVAQARRIAARTAVVELAADGSARLVHRPGLYVPRRRQLAPATVSGLPVTPAAETGGWDAALADLIVSGGSGGPIERAPDPTTRPDLDESGPEPEPSSSEPEPESGRGSGGVALADPPDPASTEQSGDPLARRHITYDEALEATRRLARRQGRPVSAEQLRTALRVGAKTARTLRDTVNAELFEDQS